MSANHAPQPCLGEGNAGQICYRLFRAPGLVSKRHFSGDFNNVSWDVNNVSWDVDNVSLDFAEVSWDFAEVSWDFVFYLGHLRL